MKRYMRMLSYDSNILFKLFKILVLIVISLLVCGFSFQSCNKTSNISHIIENVIIGELFIFSGILAQNLLKLYNVIITKTYLKANVFIPLTIIHLISLICSSINYSYHSTNSYCDSHTSVKTNLSLWLDFQICLPIFTFMAISTNSKAVNPLNRSYQLVIWLAIAFITVAQTQSSIITNITFGILSILSFTILLILFWYLKFPNQIVSITATNNELQNLKLEKMQYDTAIYNMKIIIFGIVPVFFLINIFGVANVLEGENMTICLVLFNIIYKVILTTIVGDTRVSALDIEITMSSTSLACQSTRKDILKFVFHEIRNPLNSISIGLDLFDSSTNLNQIEKESLMIMGESVNYMSETLNDVLSMQMIEDGAMKLYKSKFLIRDAIMHCVNSSRLKADNKNIRIMINYDLNMPLSVVGDRSRFEHALINLLSLAIRFTSEGYIINISVESKFTDDKCNVKIDIDGDKLSIPYDEYQLLYQPFCGKLRTAETTSRALPGYSSSGLSFLLAKDIIEMHGGSVDFTQMNGSAVKISSTIPFDVFKHRYQINKSIEDFPDISVPSSMSASPRLRMSNHSYPHSLDVLEFQTYSKGVGINQADVGILDTERDFRPAEFTHISNDCHINIDYDVTANVSPIDKEPHKIKILIVDDSSTNRKVLTLSFIKKGFECDCAENGKEAVDKVTQNLNEYSLIFMDNSMPVMNGIDSTKLIRDAGFKNLIFGLTGNSLKEDIISLSAAGADTVLSKPLRPGHIDAIINYLDENGFTSDSNYKIIMNRDSLEKFKVTPNDTKDKGYNVQQSSKDNTDIQENTINSNTYRLSPYSITSQSDQFVKFKEVEVV